MLGINDPYFAERVDESRHGIVARSMGWQSTPIVEQDAAQKPHCQHACRPQQCVRRSSPGGNAAHRPLKDPLITSALALTLKQHSPMPHLHKVVFVLFVSLTLVNYQRGLLADDWPWRGPSGNGVAADGQELVTTWSEQENVRWVADVPGRGHSSPIVSDGKVFLTTADETAETQSVLCLDLVTGQRLWMTQCHAGKFLTDLHPKNTQASPSVAVGDERVFAVFCNDDSTMLSCLDLAGRLVWQIRLGPWVPTRYQFGFGQSPIFHNGKIIVTSESETDPFIMALASADGRQLWKIERPRATSYGTPVVARIGGHEQLLIAGGQEVSSYAPETGKPLWSVDAAWVVACGTMVWHPARGLVYASGGYPTKQTLAIVADGSGKIAWENRIKCYEQSLLVAGDCVYGHAEGGVLYCWDAATGDELWVERLGGDESASPVLAGGQIFLTNEHGKTWVIRPNRSRFDLVATNQLGDEMFASLAVVDNQLLLRVADSSSGTRKERLYCIGR